MNQLDLFKSKKVEVMAECKFCKIVSGEQKGYIVYEDDISIAFLDTRPLFLGHCLLVPKKHTETIVELDNDLITPLFKNVKYIARAMEIELIADGSFVAINNRVSQSVPHLHIHIVPRHKKDGLKGFFWPRITYKDENEIIKIQQTISKGINREIENISDK